MICPDCGARIPTGMRRCGACDRPLTSVPEGPDAASALALTASATLAPSPAYPGAGHRHPRPGWRILLALVPAMLAVAAVVAVFTLRLTLVASQGTIDDLLPAGTALYAEVNLGPTGDQAANLDRIRAAFTGQPGWSRIGQDLAAAYSAGTQGRAGSGSGCPAGDTLNRVLDWTDGHAGLAITDPAALRAASAQDAAARDAVVLVVGLKIQGTLAQVVGERGLGSADVATRYKGTDLYRLAGPSGCAAARDLHGYAAIVRGYAVVGATQVAVEREIDVVHGDRPALSGVAGYSRVRQALPAARLALLYLDTPALLAQMPGSGAASIAGSRQQRQALARQTSALQAGAGPTGMAVAATATGLDLQVVQLGAGSIPGFTGVISEAATRLLPEGSLALLSTADLRATYRAVSAQLLADGLITRRDLDQAQATVGDSLDLLDGETALSLLPTDMRALAHLSDRDTTGLPLVLLVDMRRHPRAPQTIARLLTRLDPSNPPLGLAPAVAGHGIALHVNRAGYGYALADGWLVVSPSIARAVDAIEAVRHTGRPSMAAGLAGVLSAPSEGRALRGSLLVDLRALRTSLEALLPQTSSGDQAGYRDVQPLLAPWRALSLRVSQGSGGNGSQGELARLDLFIAIAP